MERKNQKIADLAEMFGSMDIEVIEGVLDQCGGKANTAAAVLLKMQEESTTNAVSVPQTEQKDELLDENFLEIDSPRDERTKKELAEENVKKEVEQVAFENFQDEQAYLAEMQKAIESSLKTSKKPEKTKFKDKVKNLFHKDKPKAKKVSEKPAKQVEKINPDDEVIQFVFKSTGSIRGENFSQAI